jgi:glucose/arabinose dehydrogenase
MTSRAILLTVLLVTACSEPPTNQSAANTQAPAKVASDDSLPENAPLDPNLKNVPATTGHANLTKSKPPFAITTIGDFDEPFAMAFLPDGRLLVTEKSGHLQLRAVDGTVKEVAFPPTVAKVDQGGLLDVALAPDFATSHGIYLTYSEPGDSGSALALMRATLRESGGQLALVDKNVIWRSGSNGPGGQFGANILFSSDGKYLFLSSGERQRFTPAQDPKQALGKILRLTLDGKAAPGNPMFDKGGVEAMTWSSGHRNPYGLIFTPDGRLWEEEMGPKGGDELNLILPGKNYGWPIVSNGDNYSGQPIPDHPSRPDLEAPKLWWKPSISPGGMILYSGNLFPEYRGNLLIGALSGEALIRVKIDGDKATALDQWDMGTRIRDVAQAPDGSIWLLEDGEKGAGGKLLRLSPKP